MLYKLILWLQDKYYSKRIRCSNCRHHNWNDSVDWCPACYRYCMFDDVKGK